MITTASGISTPHRKNVANTDRFMPMKPNMSSSDSYLPPGVFIHSAEAHNQGTSKPPDMQGGDRAPHPRTPCVSSAGQSERI